MKKLKSLLLGALATTALLVGGQVSANGNNPNFYLGLNSNGGLTFGITVGQPMMHHQPMHQPLMMQPNVIMVPPTHHVRYRPQQRHRNWRPVVRHQRPHYRPAPVVYYHQPVRYQHYHGDGHHH